VEEAKILFEIPLFGYNIGISESIVIQWVIMIILIVLSIVLTSNLKKVPDKKQTVVEMFVNTVQKVVRENMGESYLGFVPFIGTLVLFILLMNIFGLFGFEPPTREYAVTIGLAAITFIIIQAYAIKKHGLLEYFIGFTKPIVPLLPINIMERVMLPVSLSLRLFGNITAGAVIMGLIYEGLGKFAFAIPVPFHFYFDLFDGTIQMVIFVMLTMVNIKLIAEH